jgi:ribosomal protein L37AE/L43A
MKCTEKAIQFLVHSRDGIWVVCNKCGFEKNLGFHGTVEDAQQAQKEHDEREIEET